MTESDWDLGPAGELPEGAPCLRKAPNGERFVCVRRAASRGRDSSGEPSSTESGAGGESRAGGESGAGESGLAIDVLADACPHEGYPLSQGVVRDGVLTCKWHNWKFDLATGECRFGGESARRYLARVDARGHLIVDGRVDPVAERGRLER